MLEHVKQTPDRQQSAKYAAR